MYKSLALHAHGRSIMPLPLSAGKQQTRELMPSKINTITEYMYYNQRREVDSQWGLMEQSNGTIQYCVNRDTMEQSTITNGTIQYLMSMGHYNI